MEKVKPALLRGFEQEYLPTHVQMGYDLDAGTIL